MKITVDDPGFGAQSGGTTGVIADGAADAAVVEHAADPSDAHDAGSISIVDGTNVRYWPMLALSSGMATTGNYFGATDVEGALAEIGAALQTLGGGTPRYWPMLALSSGASGSLGGHLADTSDAHDASAISILDAGGLYAATDVEGALAEIGGSGTSFPASPATNDRFWRTDLGLGCYYDGTRWLTTHLYREAFTIGSTVQPAAVTGSDIGWMPVWHTTYNIWAVTYYTSLYVVTNDASNYWTLILDKKSAANVGTAIATLSTAAYAAATWVTTATVIGDLVDATTHKILQARTTTTGAPGNLYFAHALAYRLVVT